MNGHPVLQTARLRAQLGLRGDTSKQKQYTPKVANQHVSHPAPHLPQQAAADAFFAARRSRSPVLPVPKLAVGDRVSFLTGSGRKTGGADHGQSILYFKQYPRAAVLHPPPQPPTPPPPPVVTGIRGAPRHLRSTRHGRGPLTVEVTPDAEGRRILPATTLSAASLRTV